MKAELDIKPFLKAINEFATAEEQQPCGVQVVERLAYFPSAFNSAAVLPPCLRRRAMVSG
jgi:hypothetical protein